MMILLLLLYLLLFRLLLVLCSTCRLCTSWFAAMERAQDNRRTPHTLLRTHSTLTCRTKETATHILPNSSRSTARRRKRRTPSKSLTRTRRARRTRTRSQFCFTTLLLTRLKWRTLQTANLKLWSKWCLSFRRSHALQPSGCELLKEAWPTAECWGTNLKKWTLSWLFLALQIFLCCFTRPHDCFSDLIWFELLELKTGRKHTPPICLQRGGAEHLENLQALRWKLQGHKAVPLQGACHFAANEIKNDIPVQVNTLCVCVASMAFLCRCIVFWKKSCLHNYSISLFKFYFCSVASSLMTVIKAMQTVPLWLGKFSAILVGVEALRTYM